MCRLRIFQTSYNTYNARARGEKAPAPPHTFHSFVFRCCHSIGVKVRK